MRNLKRVLSLALAALMLMGMMVMGAGAVNYNDFTDKDEIVNKDAVSMLVTLGIINGMEDGSYFAPTEGVDRAMMAKMISVIMNQGVDKGDLYEKTPTGLTDVSNSWAKGHINFCYTTGIIAGRGDGTFDPNAGVTGTEAAKMLLVAAGYDPAIEGLTGSQWEIKTIALASKLGIFRNYTKPVTQALSRDDAALLIYNALDVEMIQKYEDGYAVAHDDHRTILSAMYGVYKVEGVVVANEWAELDETDSDAAQKAGKTVLDNVVLYSSTTANTTTGEGVAQAGQISFNVSTPVEFLGKTVTMYIEKTTILSNSTVLGVSTKDDVNVVTGTAASTDTLKNFVKGTGLAETKDTEYYVNYGYVSDIDGYWKKGADFNYNGIEVEVIDNNNDGDIDYVLYTVETLSKITRYSSKNENLTFTRFVDNKAYTESFDDVVFDGEFTTDDLILYVQYGGRTYISAPEIITGVMSRVDRDKNDELYITVEGETYKQSYIPDVVSTQDVDVEPFEIADAKEDIGFSTKYDFILDSNGYVVAYRPAETVVPNYALVLDSAWTQNALDVKGQVKILKADGTTGTYYINWNGSRDSAFDENADDLKYYLGTKDVLGGTNSTGAAAGTVITYSLDDDDMLTIKSVMQQNKLKTGSADIATTGGDQKVNVSNKDTQWVYIAENPSAWYENPKHPVAAYVDTPNSQYKLESDYTAGDGYVDLSANGHDKTYAIDKNTIAFYYDGKEYGVATGWDHMGTVKNPAGSKVDVQVYPVLQKTDTKTWKATNLAEVVVFGAEPTVDSADWLLVLSANAITSKVLELNVVFEDGTTKAIEVDRDEYDKYFDDSKSDYFMDAYTYVVNADGTYDLDMDSRVSNTTAELLKNGTLDVDNNKENDYDYADAVYPTVLDKSATWDVTDMTTAGEDAPAGSFVVGTKKNAVIITNNDNKILQTAWIWDIDEGTTPDPENDEYYLTIDGIKYQASDATTNVTASLWKDNDPAPDTKVSGEKVKYTYKVEFLSGDGKWVDAGVSKSGEKTTKADGTVVLNINFDSEHATNAYRITVSFQNSEIGTVTAVKAGS